MSDLTPKKGEEREKKIDAVIQCLECALKAREIEYLKGLNAKLEETVEKMNQLCIRAQASADRALSKAEHWLKEAEKQLEARCAGR